MIDRVYKIARQAEWDKAEKTGIFTGSADDSRDGFIHLSSAGQLRTTFDKYFSGEDNLLLVTLQARRLGPALRWELSRGGQEFPHLYAALPLTSVHCVEAIRRGPDGRPIFPPEIP
jgi:uncharacterized protein (DUF952 family)